MTSEVGRLGEKSLEGQLLWELEHGFELSPRESEGILETVRLLYAEKPEARSGRVSLWVVARESRVGKPLEELPKVQVWVTLDGGKEAVESYRAYGLAGNLILTVAGADGLPGQGLLERNQ